MAEVHPNAFLSLQLPEEIRNRIYGCIFAYDDSAPLRDYCETKTPAYVQISQYGHSRNWILPRVLQVNHQIQEEALSLVF